MLTSITLAENDNMRLRRIEELVAHLEQYPVAKHNAVKVCLYYLHKLIIITHYK